MPNETKAVARANVGEDVPDESEYAFRVFSKMGSVLKCPSHVQLCQQDGSPEHVFAVESGMITVAITDKDGREYYAGYRTAGWTLGTASVITGQAYPASLVALRASRVRVIGAREFMLLLAEDTKLSRYVHNLQSREIYEQMSGLSALAMYPLRKRVEEFLWRILPLVPSIDTKYELPFTDVEMARFLAATPQHLSQILRQLVDEGLIVRTRGWMVVPDRKQLWHRDNETIL